MVAVAANLHYEESFGDHFCLTYAGTTVFDTQRSSFRLLNSEARAPCNAVVAADDKVSGSLFWTTPVDCYVSGDGNCPPPSGSGIGYDGCPVEWAPLHDNQLLTLDTEPDALRHRWAWGFGHLRRAVATLGLITGKLNGMMSVSSWIPVASSGINASQLSVHSSGRVNLYNCLLPETSSREPDWIQHCRAGGDRPSTRCVDVGTLAGVGTDFPRSGAGRPVNANGYIPNRRADVAGYPSYGPPETGFGGVFKSPAEKFPCSVKPWSGSPLCTPNGGVDPQMVYCALPTEVALSDEATDIDPYADWTDGGAAGARIFFGNAPIFPARLSVTVGRATRRSNSISSGPKRSSRCGQLRWATSAPIRRAHRSIGGLFAHPPRWENRALQHWRAMMSSCGSGDFRAGGFLGDPTYAARDTVAGWFTAGESNSAGLMLFDLEFAADLRLRRALIPELPAYQVPVRDHSAQYLRRV